MRIRKLRVFAIVLGIVSILLITLCTKIEADSGGNYYVSNSGDDNNSGASPEEPWKTVSKVNTSVFRPGDTIHFECGSVWREQLIPRSGSEAGYISYTSYGTGEKPTFLGSIDKSSTSDWHEISPDIWALDTPGAEKNSAAFIGPEAVKLYSTEGISPQTEIIGSTYTLVTGTSGGNQNDLQLSIGNLAVERGKTYLLSFSAKCGSSFELPPVNLMRTTAPWQPYSTTHSQNSVTINDHWTEYRIFYKANTSDPNARITFYLGKVLPANTAFRLKDVYFMQPPADPVFLDVGNIIFDQGKAVGRKVFYKVLLKKQNDFWYDRENRRVLLFSKGNPAERYKSIECALRNNIIEQSNGSYIRYGGLKLLYGGAHGIGGSNTHHIIIDQCEIGYIGGADQETPGKNVRFGNGIEFWGYTHDNIVSNCNIYQIYDSGVTNQSSYDTAAQYRISYFKNTISKCEMAYEFWNRGRDAYTSQIFFEKNICENSGMGWSHTQRPDPSGVHVMFYSSPGNTARFVIRNNTFKEAALCFLKLPSSWIHTDQLVLEKNKASNKRKVIQLICGTKKYATLSQWNTTR